MDIVNQGNQSEKATILYESNYRKRETIETVKKAVDARDSGGIEAG